MKPNESIRKRRGTPSIVRVALTPIQRYSDRMTGRTAPTEAAPYYYTYIDCISIEDVLAALESQIGTAVPLFMANTALV